MHATLHVWGRRAIYCLAGLIIAIVAGCSAAIIYID